MRESSFNHSIWFLVQCLVTFEVLESVLQFFPLVLHVDLKEILNLCLDVTLNLRQLCGGLHGEDIEVVLEGVGVVGAPVHVRGDLGKVHNVLKDHLGREEPFDLSAYLTRDPSLTLDSWEHTESCQLIFPILHDSAGITV